MCHPRLYVRISSGAPSGNIANSIDYAAVTKALQNVRQNI